MAALATALLTGALAAPFAVVAQDPPPFPMPLAMCAAPPSPQTDTWPQAVTDSLGSTAGVPVTFSAATLVANDIGASLTVRRVGPASSYGGTITGTGPFTFTPAAGYVGTDVFAYEVIDANAWTTTGIVKISVTREAIAPSPCGAPPDSGSSKSGRRRRPAC